MYKKTDNANIIGSKIKELRMLKGLTQEQLSEKLEIDNRKLSRIETGKSMPSVKITQELSKFFNFNLYDLVDVIADETIEIPDSYYVQSVNILKSAVTKQEKLYYLEALKHTQKCLQFEK